MSFHEWMRCALYDETDGYYMRSDHRRWGAGGDYRTSPETSELFAATFAGYFAALFEHMGRPERWRVVECGPGDGSFAEGVLKALCAFFPAVFEATQYFVDEISTAGTDNLRRRLEPFNDHITFGRLSSLEVMEGIVFSNELLDTFPVNRLTKRNGELLELYVAIGAAGQFEWVEGPVSDPRLLEMYAENNVEIGEGHCIELSTEIDEWLKMVAQKLRLGYLITVDYGAEATELYNNPERRQGTLRAYSRHKFVDVLEKPGERDITSHVNWTRVKNVGTSLGLSTVLFERQDKFLLNAGILNELARRSGAEKTEADKLRLSTAAREMILPNSMASTFQVLVQKKG